GDRSEAFRVDPGRGGARRVCANRRTPGRAAHPRCPQPRERRGPHRPAPGPANRETPAAAPAAARARGVDDATIAEALETFPGVAHRLEPVADANGVLYVNDSKATNTAGPRRGAAAHAPPPA